MAKVNMMQLREHIGVAVDGTEFYTTVTLKPGETICTECEGTGRDPVYDYGCLRCDGKGITTQEDEQ